MKVNHVKLSEVKEKFKLINGRLYKKTKTNRWVDVPQTANSGGYCITRSNYIKYSCHRIIWMLHYNRDIPDNMIIDHLNGSKHDNRIENLELKDIRGNAINRKHHRAGNLYGARFCKSRKVWQSGIMISGKNVFLGRFNSEKEAHQAYKVALREINLYTTPKEFRSLIMKTIEKRE